MSNYFSSLPNFEYISRINERQTNQDYITVKNIFRRALIREDLFADFMAFEKYKIIGDERPDSIAFKLYGDEDLDWGILAANNVINVRDEWPMTQHDFNRYLLNKYGSIENYNQVKHYKTTEVKDSKGKVFVKKGKIVDKDFKVTFLDSGTNSIIEVNPIESVTFLTYEEGLQNDKRNINILKSRFLPKVLNELETVLDYEISSEYINPKLKKGSNPNLG